MNRKDIIPIVILIALLFAWGPLSQRIFPPAPVDEDTGLPHEDAMESIERTAPTRLDTEYTGRETPPVFEPDDPSPEPEPEPEPARLPEQQVVLVNEKAEVVLSSWGGGIRYIRLFDYRATLESEDDEPVVMDFDDTLALTYRNAIGFSRQHDFQVIHREDDSVHFKAETLDGLVMIRKFEMDPENPYRFFVRDTFENTGAEPLRIGEHAIQLGPLMPETTSIARSRIAGAALGLDVLPSGGGQRVRHWSKKRFMSSEQMLGDIFYPDGYSGPGCSPFGGRRLPAQLPRSKEKTVKQDTDWLAVKNKFFVQILAPRDHAVGYAFEVEREVPEHELSNRPETWSSLVVPASIAATLTLDGFDMQPGDTFERRYSYYAGPKKLAALQPLGNRQGEVMEFGRLRRFCRVLLRALNGLYGWIPNYGIAVMLLTIIIRVIFWPITRKSTESMKRMQELQPEMKALRERYKDNPQKMQQETMALYKKNKVNPVAGCLPMVIQIPVFFALFTVLRSAVELRFAGFLWIRDLSEPENLLAGMVPFVGSLNILPLLMTGTMVWQQHLTPSAGDPSQRRMMMMMPVVMLVFFYSMPSALVLYWTTNQCLMIAQLIWQRKMKAGTQSNPVAPNTAPKNTSPSKPLPAPKPAAKPAQKQNKGRRKNKS